MLGAISKSSGKPSKTRWTQPYFLVTYRFHFLITTWRTCTLWKMGIKRQSGGVNADSMDSQIEENEYGDPQSEQDVFAESTGAPTERQEDSGFVDPGEHVPEVHVDGETEIGEAVERAHALESQHSRATSSDLALLKTDICTFISGEIRGVVESFNVLLKKGLGEVDSKYPVALLDFVEEFDPLVHGQKFPNHLLSSNFDLSNFKVTIFEFRNLTSKHASKTLRDVNRFLGCFAFPDDAGGDLAYLTVSIFKSGLIKRLLLSRLWQGKSSYIVSLKTSLGHFVGFLEHEARLERAFGGLTTALTNIQQACVFTL